MHRYKCDTCSVAFVNRLWSEKRQLYHLVEVVLILTRWWWYLRRNFVPKTRRPTTPSWRLRSRLLRHPFFVRTTLAIDYQLQSTINCNVLLIVNNARICAVEAFRRADIWRVRGNTTTPAGTSTATVSWQIVGWSEFFFFFALSNMGVISSNYRLFLSIAMVQEDRHTYMYAFYNEQRKHYSRWPIVIIDNVYAIHYYLIEIYIPNVQPIGANILS